MGILPGDKVLIMRHPVHKGLMIYKIEHVREFLDDFSNFAERISQESIKVSEEGDK